MLTLQEYMNKHNMTVSGLVRLTGICDGTLRKYLKGYPAQPTQHAKLEAVGIKHPKVITTTVRPTKKKSEIKPKEPASKVTQWQTKLVIEFGNTIISKDLTKVSPGFNCIPYLLAFSFASSLAVAPIGNFLI